MILVSATFAVLAHMVSLNTPPISRSSMNNFMQPLHGTSISRTSACCHHSTHFFTYFNLLTCGSNLEQQNFFHLQRPVSLKLY
ncbi:hypothetical protein AB6A40_001392 [Gnathostoma spinigerum]|uniref:Secreted protein n=1 Tax=Gnathostoma spinigerum TaxID=75299 RepID=A0ABD6ECX9_9BILA